MFFWLDECSLKVPSAVQNSLKKLEYPTSDSYKNVAVTSVLPFKKGISKFNSWEFIENGNRKHVTIRHQYLFEIAETLEG